MTTKKKLTTPQVSTVVYTEPWGIFTKGAPVSIASARTDGKKGHTYTFLHHVVNTATGDEWIDVLNVTRKTEKISSFKVEEVYLIQPKRKYVRKTQ